MADGSGAHRLHAQGAADWDISPEVLAFIKAHVKPGMKTIETGAGRSTLAFVAAGAEHTAITPSASEIAAITAAAHAEGMNPFTATMIEGFSQDVLPGLSGELDFALIDGGHGFPIPTIDWTYIVPRLKVGGIVMIDDVDLWTGKMLIDFMEREAGFEHVATLRGRTAAFRLTERFAFHEWTKQPFVVEQSRWTQRARKAKNVLGMLARFDLATLKAKFANEKRLAQAAKDDY